MEQQIERWRAEVDEGGEQAPVLGFVVDAAEGVEELEGREGFGVGEEGGGDGGGGPQAGEEGEFVEPLFEGEGGLVLHLGEAVVYDVHCCFRCRGGIGWRWKR